MMLICVCIASCASLSAASSITSRSDFRCVFVVTAASALSRRVFKQIAVDFLVVVVLVFVIQVLVVVQSFVFGDCFFLGLPSEVCSGIAVQEGLGTAPGKVWKCFALGDWVEVRGPRAEAGPFLSEPFGVVIVVAKDGLSNVTATQQVNASLVWLTHLCQSLAKLDLGLCCVRMQMSTDFLTHGQGLQEILQRALSFALLAEQSTERMQCFCIFTAAAPKDLLAETYRLVQILFGFLVVFQIKIDSGDDVEIVSQDRSHVTTHIYADLTYVNFRVFVFISN
mmetsp:Transcript_68121/g.128692  ORF Transcript_68121/g.128692 Transcript_68121/m.128692 type:complete len:281 (+) Transcript_68121:2-844(+)